jgi:hypothetical protein
MLSGANNESSGCGIEAGSFLLLFMRSVIASVAKQSIAAEERWIASSLRSSQ